MNPQNFGFPKRENSSRSCWLQGVEDDPLLHHNTTSTLPSWADIVIIGSGMTGTLVAKHCIDTWPDKSVVVLEAREFCSGATGRNAGHCKPDQWRGFLEYKDASSTQQALKIIDNEWETWSELVAFVKRNNVNCDLWVGDTLDVPVTPEAAEEAKYIFDSYRAAGGNINNVKVTHDPVKAAKMSRIKDAQACYSWPASTLYPWKLAAHVMRDNIKRGVNLQTHNMVRKVIESPRNPGKWVVQSERGKIECSQVVHASNAYCSAVEASLRGLICPSPHMCNEIKPPITFAGSQALKNSYGVLLPKGGLITINPRIPMDGSVLFGGSNPGQREFERWLHNHLERGVDDGLSGFSSVTEAVQTFVESQFVDWPASKSPEEINKHSWSGIIALSADGVPFVGELPGLPGQWICAGHHGHGMARIFTAAPGLVRLMGGGTWADTNLPEVFEVTPSRIERIKQRWSAKNVAVPRL